MNTDYEDGQLCTVTANRSENTSRLHGDEIIRKTFADLEGDPAVCDSFCRNKKTEQSYFGG